MARAKRASGEAKPKANRVIRRILVLTASMRPLDRLVLDGGQDRRALFDDGALQGHERLDPGSAGPADPGVEGGDGLVVWEPEDQPQPFFEQVGAMQPGFTLGDPFQLRALPGGEVFGVLP